MPKYLQILICDNTLFSAVLKKLNSLKKTNKPLFNAAVPHACESETTKLRGQEWAVQAAGWGGGAAPCSVALSIYRLSSKIK